MTKAEICLAYTKEIEEIRSSMLPEDTRGIIIAKRIKTIKRYLSEIEDSIKEYRDSNGWLRRVPDFVKKCHQEEIEQILAELERVTA